MDFLFTEEKRFRQRFLPASRIRFIMKVSLAYIIVSCSLISLCAASPSFGQGLDKKVTIEMNNEDLTMLFAKLKQQTGLSFVLTGKVSQYKEVTFAITDESVRKVLDHVLAGKNLGYRFKDNTVFIYETRVSDTAGTTAPEPVPSKKQEGSTRAFTVSGTISDGATKEPLAGVNIVVKGTTRGTTSDANGKFAIDASDEDILVFSFIGFQTQEIKVSGRTVIDLELAGDTQTLDAVTVNAGYWQVKEKEQTGNIARITSSEIRKQPVNNVLGAMIARMPGVNIQQKTGVPGGGFDIQIRGQNSLRGKSNAVNGNLPLYIIDGVPFTSTSLMSNHTSGSILGGNPLSVINPNDIESIEVLKDADATAIYGSRGSNGVVLITTKKGKAGKTRVDIDVSRGAGQATNRIDLLNTQQYLEMRQEALKNDGYDVLLEDPSYDIYWPDLKIWDTNRYTDWQEELIGGTANTTNAQASLSWGNDNTQFLVSGNFYKETTVFPGNNDFTRGTGHFNLNHKSDNQKLEVNFSATYANISSNLPLNDFTLTAVTLSPNAPALYNADGTLNWENDTWRNPMADLERTYESTTGSLVVNSSLRYEILKGLYAKTVFGFTSMEVNEMAIFPLSSFSPTDPLNKIGTSTFANSGLKTWIVEPQLEYKKIIGPGTLNVILGSTFQESTQESKTIKGSGYTIDALLKNIDAAPTLDIMDANYFQYRYTSILGRINYTLKDKYILNLTGRRDGSSRFGPGKRFGNFGAAGVAWVFTNENFLKSSNFINFGKLRASYGITGSDQIGNYQYLNSYSTTLPYNGSNGLALTRLNNPDFSWETNKKFEVGLETGMFSDRIYVSASWYRNRSSDQLVGLPLPVITGQSTIQYNFPAVVENKGLEFILNTQNIRGDRFNWSTSFNITIPKNTLVEFPDIDAFPAYKNNLEIGRSLYITKGFKYTGVDPQTGLYTFEDIDQDGSVTSLQDYVVLKELTQQYYGGFNNSFSYKGLQLDIFFQFVKQNGTSYLGFYAYPGDMSNQPTVVMNRWQQPGDISDIQMFTAFDANGIVSQPAAYRSNSDYLRIDASFIRLKNVSLSWQLPGTWLEAARITSTRIYVQGQNLLTFTNYPGTDPESQAPSVLPPLRMLTFGIQLTL
jgi:TonB-dependent starch-binding outer membrane protein SusC